MTNFGRTARDYVNKSTRTKIQEGNSRKRQPRPLNVQGTNENEIQSIMCFLKYS